MISIFKKLFTGGGNRQLAHYRSIVNRINHLEPNISKLSDDHLKAKTPEFREQIAKGRPLIDVLPEAFAVVREAGKRVLNMRHYDVQLIGGIVLHDGNIAEMRTGEGKTLVATLPSYLNALTGKGVHIVTVNDYLAKRDSGWEGQIHKFLGLTVGCIVDETTRSERKQHYGYDITYGTNHEFGFDYLRDNMVYSVQNTVMLNRGFNYAIVDEVDSILIDEARTPLIISGATDTPSELYMKMSELVKKLKNTDFELDEKSRAVSLTDGGMDNIEQILKKEGMINEYSSLYDIESERLLHHLNQALKATKLFKTNVDYIVKNGRVVIIDEFTGRMMEDRRFSDGLHQALEAKEKVNINSESQTLASITYQNYFRMYDKLAGMTGTASTEAKEFGEIYGLSVIPVPTQLPVVRADKNDMIYKTSEEKYDAIIGVVEEAHKKHQPVLLGTISVEKSELLSERLTKKKIPHQVLNAKYHEQEANIIANAGRKGMVTIATNMAGRGTDIKLGGNLANLIEEYGEEKAKKIQESEKKAVIEAGGLFVIGSERHESRRIDNQLRGRSGRQGDPGASQFFLSMQDDLLRIFGGQKIETILNRLGFKKGESINSPLLTRAIERAQKRVESYNYDIRKNLLKYDDIINEQRRVVYKQRLEIVSRNDVGDISAQVIGNFINSLIHKFAPQNAQSEYWQRDAILHEMIKFKVEESKLTEIINDTNITDQKEMILKLQELLVARYNLIKNNFPSDVLFLDIEKKMMIEQLDYVWKYHLYSIDNLRRGVGLLSYAQKDPLNEYKIESFRMFERMMEGFEEMFLINILRMELMSESEEMVKGYAEKRGELALQIFGNKVFLTHPGAQIVFTPVENDQAVNAKEKEEVKENRSARRKKTK